MTSFTNLPGNQSTVGETWEYTITRSAGSHHPGRTKFQFKCFYSRTSDQPNCITSVAKQWTCIFGTKCAFNIAVTKGSRPSSLNLRSLLADENALRRVARMAERGSAGATALSQLASASQSSAAGWSQRSKRGRSHYGDSDDDGEGEEGSKTSDCSICLSTTANVVFVPCGHMCVCSSCSKAVDKCPMCRSTITVKQKVYVWRQI